MLCLFQGFELFVWLGGFGDGRLVVFYLLQNLLFFWIEWKEMVDNCFLYLYCSQRIINLLVWGISVKKQNKKPPKKPQTNAVR